MEQNKIQKIIAITKITSVVSLVFIVLISLLLIINYIQVKRISPVEGDRITKLVNKLNQNPEDEELRQQIRTVDLLSRKAFFTSQWMFYTGGFLLLGALIVLLASIKINAHYKPLSLQLNTNKTDYWELKSGERTWLLVAVGIFVLSAGILAVLSKDAYVDFSKQNLAANGKTIASSQVKLSNEDAKITSKDTAKLAIDTTKVNALDENDFPKESEIKQNFNCFRGPYGQGISYSSNIPTEWDAPSGKNIKWKATPDLPGLNSPIVWGNFVFVSGADASKRKIYCYDAQNGKLIWSKPVDKIEGSPAEAPKVNIETGYAASGLTTDGKRVFAIFPTGDVICFDFEGNRLWAKNLGVPSNHYGHSSSLILHQNLLIVQYDHSKTRNLIAFSVHTGDVKWNTTRPGKISWSSPILVKHEGKSTIVVNNDPFVAGYDASTGSEVWKIDALTGEVGASPAYSNGVIFSANEYAKLVAIKLGSVASVLWEANDYLPDVSSPVAYKDMLFIATSGGEAACVNALDGTVIWNHEFEVGFYASPMIADGKLFLMDRNGTTHIVKADKTFSLIADCKLGEKSDCTPAFANGKIFLRGKKGLYCVGK